jgi:hypothetical protein
MGPAGPEIINDCAGEGQQQFIGPNQWDSWKVSQLRVMRQKIMVMGPTVPKTKNQCAGNGQKKITRPD